jgi:hypothetical protein
MNDVFASIAATAITITLVLSGSAGEALSLGHALGIWLDGGPPHLNRSSGRSCGFPPAVPAGMD